ncbi:MAG: hypothetical protein Q7S98_02000 [Deltaproteobacteria bacterium]|nr:hypothetical protein [Deltaproteobacteria bacterium]
MKLNGQSVPFKVVVTCFLVLQLIGFGVAIVQIHDRTAFSVEKTILHYRGAESEAEKEMFLPQSYRSLLSVAHVHTMSQPLILFLIGLLFVFSSLKDGMKIFFVLLSFGSCLLSNLSPWLLRYVSAKTAIFFPLSSALMIGTFLFMAAFILYDLWREEES